MREILFRGKRADNGEWVEGYLCRKYFQDPPHDRLVIQYKTKHEAGRWVPDYMVAEVIPDTVGMFSGLKDREGKRIFEGDIVRHYNDCPDLEIEEKGIVFQDEEYCGWRRTSNGAFHHGVVDTYRLSPTCVYGVIGNIHDSPELLTEE